MQEAIAPTGAHPLGQPSGDVVTRRWRQALFGVPLFLKVLAGTMASCMPELAQSLLNAGSATGRLVASG